MRCIIPVVDCCISCIRMYRCIQQGECHDKICTHRRTPLLNMETGKCESDKRSRRQRHQSRPRHNHGRRSRKGREWPWPFTHLFCNYAAFHWARKLVFTSFPVGNIVPLKSEVVFRSGKLGISASTPTSDSEIRVGNTSFRAQLNAALATWTHESAIMREWLTGAIAIRQAADCWVSLRCVQNRDGSTSP